MPYDPNTTRWPVGALVIHAADAKRRDMLMRVVGYRADGCALTRYEFPGGRTLRGKLPNDIRYLHDPARFGIADDAAGAGR